MRKSLLTCRILNSNVRLLEGEEGKYASPADTACLEDAAGIATTLYGCRGLVEPFLDISGYVIGHTGR